MGRWQTPGSDPRHPPVDVRLPRGRIDAFLCQFSSVIARDAATLERIGAIPKLRTGRGRPCWGRLDFRWPFPRGRRTIPEGWPSSGPRREFDPRKDLSIADPLSTRQWKWHGPVIQALDEFLAALRASPDVTVARLFPAVLSAPEDQGLSLEEKVKRALDRDPGLTSKSLALMFGYKSDSRIRQLDSWKSRRRSTSPRRRVDFQAAEEEMVRRRHGGKRVGGR
jgi:hypothetical protein